MEGKKRRGAAAVREGGESGGARGKREGGSRGENGADGGEDGEEQGEGEDGDEDGHVNADEERGGAEKRSEMKLAGTGGKGGGGRWIFVSHEPVDMAVVEGRDFSSFLGLQKVGEAMDAGRQFMEARLVHFKFEPTVRGFLILFIPLESFHPRLLDCFP